VREIRLPGGARLGYFIIGDRTARAVIPAPPLDPSRIPEEGRDDIPG
jgi:hypothetical protein